MVGSPFISCTPPPKYLMYGGRERDKALVARSIIPPGGKFTTWLPWLEAWNIFLAVHVQPPSPGSPPTGEVSWCGDPPDSPFALLNTSQVRPLAQNYQVHHQPHQPVELPTSKGPLCSFTYKCWVAGCGGETTQPRPALEGPPGGRITTLQTNPAILAQGSLTNCLSPMFCFPLYL